MAAVLQSSLQISRRQLPVACVSVISAQPQRHASDVKPLKRPSLAHMKKGPGGRSSFNGVVATVFGSSGLLGCYVANQLGKTGTQLILPYRGDFYDMLRLKLVGDLGQVLFLPFDPLKEEDIRKAVRYSNVVVNLIGRDWPTKNFTFENVHVDLARRIARISKEEGVERLIHLSALNCSPNPKPLILKNGSSILRTKYHGEQAVREEFPDAIIIRPSVVYGNQDRFLLPYSQPWRRDFRRLPVYKKGEETIKAPVSANDIAMAIHQAIRDPSAPGRTYQAVGPRRYVLADLIDWFFQLLRRYPEDGYKRVDLYHSTIPPRMLFFEMLPGNPMISLTREIMEREVTTDVIDPSLPTLEDLGVRPTLMDDEVPWIMAALRRGLYYRDSVGEFPIPKPAPHLA